jgi:hypothetical protein
MCKSTKKRIRPGMLQLHLKPVSLKTQLIELRENASKVVHPLISGDN